MPHKDPDRRRAYERERHRRKAAKHKEMGLCPKCGHGPPAPGRSMCASCLARSREAERARYGRKKAEDMPYGGRCPESRRRMARERSRKRRRERTEAGLCTGCGKVPPVDGGAVCEPCREERRAAERKLYARRRAGGRCGRCGAEVLPEGELTLDKASRCASCAARDLKRRPRKNVSSRARYAKRRAQRLCVDCARPAGDSARCDPCARRSWHSSGEHKGMPVYPPRYTVVDPATGMEHGPLDSWEEVAMYLAFAKLPREEVEIVTDAPFISTLAAWE